MNIEKLIHDLRARINPQYYDQIGTESYERHQVVKALELLRQENERLRNDAERYRWLRSDASAYQAQTILNDQPDAIDAAIDAARGAKPETAP